MGRGGPREPEVITVPPTVDALVELSRSGRHAASDHLETAALTGVETVGCRRCGGGLAGCRGHVERLEGAAVAAELAPDLVVFDGSGAALPPIAADRTIVVVGGHQDPAVVAGYLNTYRLLLADLVVVTMAEAAIRLGARTAAAVRRSFGRRSTVVGRCCGRGRSSTSAGGRWRISALRLPPRHAVLAEHLRRVYGADVVHVSGNLGRPRPASRRAPTRRGRRVPDRAQGRCRRLRRRGRARKRRRGRARGKRLVPAGDEDLDEMLLEVAKFT